MTEASLAAQRFAVTTMRAYSPLISLVPPLNIFDKSSRPEIFPCVIVGDAQVVGDDIECAELSTVFLTIHAWTVENGLSNVKNVSGAIRRALRNAEGEQDGFSLSFAFADTVYLRDPDGAHSHAILSFEIEAEDLA